MVEASRDSDEIRQTAEVGAAFLRLRAFMFRNVYLAPPAEPRGRARRRRGARAVHAPLRAPRAAAALARAGPRHRATDFVAGMTDRYALRAYAEAFMPREGPL